MAKKVSLSVALILAIAVFWMVWRQRGEETPERAEPTWRAGVAAMEITPEEPMWLSGYASRDRPSEGTLSPLWAKALALEDPTGRPLLLVTMDLIGIDRGSSNRIRDALRERHGLERPSIILSTSHTHTGPVVGENLQPMYALSATHEDKVREYTAFVEEREMTGSCG